MTGEQFEKAKNILKEIDWCNAFITGVKTKKDITLTLSIKGQGPYIEKGCTDWMKELIEKNLVERRDELFKEFEEL